MRKLRLLTLFLLFGLTPPIAAQVYQSTDEDGNVTFSDQPTDDSKKVTIQESNIADPVEVPPPAPEPEPEPEPDVEETRLPENLEGDLVGIETKERDRSRPRKEPRSSN